MARVQVAPVADEDLADLIDTHHLPADTRTRVKRCIEPLARHPLSGQAVGGGAWAGFRTVGGPWSWMLIVYDFDADADTVTVATIQDARTSTAATSHRR